MNFFRALFMDDYGIDVSRFLRRFAIFLIYLSIAILLIATGLFITFMLWELHPAAEIMIFAGIPLSICIFLYAMNLLAFSVIGSNTAQIRRYSRKNMVLKKNTENEKENG